MYRMLDVLLRWVSRVLGADVERAGTTERIGRDVNLHVFVSGVREYGTALRAMRAHGSQTKWYRWLYVAFSRYMWVNEWVEVEVDRLGDVK